MASPLSPTKPTVDLSAPGVRGSRIRRDPPKKVKAIDIEERNARHARMVVIGITAFAIAICVVLLGIASMTGWTPREYILRV